ncbi:MAG: phosphoribosylanthranilate isomerase [Acidobacteriia bacterium]|nr:phosphoribosylanthranilate isomerase [Terriglobia bacterium]
MTWIKICGTTNLEDALVAVDAGADAVGFVFYEKSPRKISPEAARKIVEKLPEGVEKIGVFVNGDLVEPLDVVFHAGLTGLQTYPSAGGGGQASSLKAVRVSSLPRRPRFLISVPMNLPGGNEGQIQGSAADLEKSGKTLAEFASLSQGLLDTFVLDSGDLRQPGGTGKTFDWKRAVPVVEGMRQGGVKLVVAGGLTPENVGEAISILKPWGVDVASGVEARPGKKDPEKVQAFVRAVREMDRKTS